VERRGEEKRGEERRSEERRSQERREANKLISILLILGDKIIEIKMRAK
jgi:hypothetical protein